MVSEARAALRSAVLAVVDRDGAGRLDHAAVATAAGIDVGTVRAAVPSSDGLADLVVEAIVAESPPPPTAAPDGWASALRLIGLGHRATLLEHPNALGIVARRPVRTVQGLDVVERHLAALAAGGLDAPYALAALNAVVVWTHGYVMAELGAEGLAIEGADDRDGHPHLSRALASTTWGLPDGEFVFGLDALIAGLRADLHA